MLEQVRALRAADVDAVNVVDGPRAQSRMGVLPAALIIEREVGLDTVFHYTCRDRNMLGMLSDLLGAAAGGLRNILIVTGDPPTSGPYPDATAVFDIDSIGLTNVVHQLNRGLDPGGNPIGEPTRFVIGVAANQSAVDLELELERFHWKVEAGAEFAVTQPVFDPEELCRFLERIERFRIPVIAGLWPLGSLRNAEFLANEVPGVKVPAETLERMRRAETAGPGGGAGRGTADRPGGPGGCPRTGPGHPDQRAGGADRGGAGSASFDAIAAGADPGSGSPAAGTPDCSRRPSPLRSPAAPAPSAHTPPRERARPRSLE